MRSLLSRILAASVLVLAAASGANSQDFVGRLSLAIDPQVAKDVGLSDAEVAKLKTFIDARLNEAAPLVAQIKSLPKGEQDAKLAEFIAESEKQGLGLLTDDQKAKLNKIRIAKSGMSGVLDSEVAEQLKLSQQQKDEIAKIIGTLKTASATGTDIQKRSARSIYEKKIASLLTEEQTKAWEAMSGVPAIPTAAAPAANTVAAGPGGARPAG